MGFLVLWIPAINRVSPIPFHTAYGVVLITGQNNFQKMLRYFPKCGPHVNGKMSKNQNF